MFILDKGLGLGLGLGSLQQSTAQLCRRSVIVIIKPPNKRAPARVCVGLLLVGA